MKMWQTGQKVILVNRDRKNENLYEETVDKVGKKYFTLVGDNRSKYFIESGLLVSVYSTGTRVYATHQELLDEKELARLRQEAMSFFAHWGANHLNAEQLKSILLIIKPEEQK